MCDERSEIRIERDEHAAVINGGGEHDRIRGTRQTDITHMLDVVTRSDERIADQRRDALVEEESQAPRRRGSSRSRTASAAYSSASRTSSRSRSG